MSHLTTIKIEIKDLESLKSACTALGLEFVPNQLSFRYFASKREECDHAIRVLNNNDAYEIGVIKSQNGYELKCDFWRRGGLEPIIGKNACNLKREYTKQVAYKQMLRQGYKVRTVVNDKGGVNLICTK